MTNTREYARLEIRGAYGPLSNMLFELRRLTLFMADTGVGRTALQLAYFFEDAPYILPQHYVFGEPVWETVQRSLNSILCAGSLLSLRGHKATFTWEGTHSRSLSLYKYRSPHIYPHGTFEAEIISWLSLPVRERPKQSAFLCRDGGMMISSQKAWSNIAAGDVDAFSALIHARGTPRISLYMDSPTSTFTTKQQVSLFLQMIHEGNRVVVSNASTGLRNALEKEIGNVVDIKGYQVYRTDNYEVVDATPLHT